MPTNKKKARGAARRAKRDAAAPRRRPGEGEFDYLRRELEESVEQDAAAESGGASTCLARAKAQAESYGAALSFAQAKAQAESMTAYAEENGAWVAGDPVEPAADAAVDVAQPPSVGFNADGEPTINGMTCAEFNQIGLELYGGGAATDAAQPEPGAIGEILTCGFSPEGGGHRPIVQLAGLHIVKAPNGNKVNVVVLSDGSRWCYGCLPLDADAISVGCLLRLDRFEVEELGARPARYVASLGTGRGAETRIFRGRVAAPPRGDAWIFRGWVAAGARRG